MPFKLMAAVYYKFRSEKKWGSISMIDCFVSVSSVKQKIFESRYVTMGFDLDIEIANAQTGEVYLDEATLIPKNTSVLIRRIPRYRHMRYGPRHYESNVESNFRDNLSMNTTITQEMISTVKDVEPLELDDGFGDDIYVSAPAVEATSVKNKEDLKIKALVATPALSWESRADEGFGPGRGFGRMMGGRAFGRTSFECQKPPQGYVCHRCNKPGHLIQHCPTNGDPDYDTKKFKPPTGISKTMLIANPEGSYVLPDGGAAAATVKTDEFTLGKEIERMPTSSHSLGDLPPELYCLLCKQVMKDAVLTSKCCFNSFCDKCMRDYIISKSVCVCGAKDVLADDLIPNKTLRDTIIRMLESSSSSSNNNDRSGSQLQDTALTWSAQPKSVSPSQSADPSESPAQRASDELKTDKVPDVSETAHEVKKKKARLGVVETSPYFAAMPNYASPYGYVPCWTGFQPGMEGYMGYGSTPLYHMMPPQRENGSFRSSKNSYEHVCNKKRKLSSECKPSDVKNQSSNDDHHCKRKRSSEHTSPVIRELAVL